MRFTTTLLLGLSAGAFAVPTANATNSTLEKRFSYSWVGNFPDPSCDERSMVKSSPDSNDGFRQEVHRGSCVIFQPRWEPYVGIDWGVGKHYGFSVLAAYRDDKCKDQVATVTNTKGEAGAGVALSNFTEGGPHYGAMWNTVKAIS